MQQDTELEKILLRITRISLEAIRYYQHASRFIRDDGVIHYFSLLAREELERARNLYTMHGQGSLADFSELTKSPAQKTVILNQLDPKQLSRMNERTALFLAIKMEGEIVKQLQQLLTETHNPHAQELIRQRLETSHGNMELLTEDYRKIPSGSAEQETEKPA